MIIYSLDAIIIIMHTYTYIFISISRLYQCGILLGKWNSSGLDIQNKKSEMNKSEKKDNQQQLVQSLENQ